MGDTRDFARFRGAQLIGRGGFGSVYKATDEQHGREVAIKVLPGSLGETERRRFDRERQTMGRLGSHPNIIPVHESGYTDEGEAYIVMELATGGSLRDRLEADGTVPWHEAVSIMTAIANAAQAAHDQGVLHRDIKPDNILIDGWGNPRLTDFGIAAVATNATATTSTTATVVHAAPEVLEGHPSTAAVDIYAISSTLYNLITGWPPFQRSAEDGVTAIIGRALTQPPPDLRAYGVPDAVARAAEQALAKDLNHRQHTAAQFAAELTRAAAGGADQPSPQYAPGAAAGATVVSPPPVHNPAVAGPPPGTGPYASPGQPVGVGAPLPGLPPPPGQWLHQAGTAAVGPPSLGHYTPGGQGPGAPSPWLPPASPPPRSKNGALWILSAIGVVVVVGAIGWLLATRDDSGQELVNTGASSTASTADGLDGSQTTPSTADSITNTSATAETTTTTTATTVSTTTTTSGTTTTEFFGVDFDTPISWSFGGAANFNGYVTTSGEFGELTVDYVDVNGVPTTVIQDLTLTQLADGTWVYEGSNPRFAADGTAATPYSPDTLTFSFDAASGLYFVDEVCNDFYAGCTFVT
jgi:serine/threonine protein kinase